MVLIRGLKIGYNFVHDVELEDFTLYLLAFILYPE